MVENQTVKERLTAYIKYLGVGQGKFETICGLANGYVNNIRKSITPEKLQQIARQCPDLNTGWLMTGEGEMLRSSIIQQAGDIEGSENHVNVYNSSQTIEKMVDAITSQQRLTENAQRQTDKAQAQIDKAQAQIDRLLALLEKCHSVERQNITQ